MRSLVSIPALEFRLEVTVKACFDLKFKAKLVEIAGCRSWVGLK